MSTLEDRLNAPRSVMAVWGAYGSLADPDVRPFREGMTLYEIMLGMDCLPAGFEQRGVIQINGHEINRGAWHLVRPKPSMQAKPIAVTFHMPPRGGGKGGGGKSVIGIVAAVALLVITTAITGGALGPAGFASISSTLFAAGSTSAQLLAGAVGLIGALAISALVRPPVAKPKEDRNDQTESASADGNLIQPNGAVPRVIGTRKIFPPLACEPFVDLVGQDEYAEMVAILNGPHALSSIKVGAADITDDTAIEYQTREGWESDTLMTLVNRYSRTITPNLELSQHKLDSANGTLLENATTTPLKSLPQWHRFTTKDSPDEVYIGLALPAGLNYPADPATYPLALPVRIRIRKQGNANWINLPEIHIKGRNSRPVKYQVILKWDAPVVPPSTDVVMTSGDGIANIYYRCPIQTTAPADPGTYQWEADASFYSGSGNTYMINGSVTGMQNIYVDQNDRSPDGLNWSPNGSSAATVQKNSVHVFLNSGTFPKGVYEIEIMRGVAYATPSWLATTYQYGLTVYNLFKFYGSGTLNANQTLYVASIAATKISSVWKSAPLPYVGFATIAIRAKNRRIENVSCIASGYVRDWDGTSWATWTTTSNPAPHFRDVLMGRLNFDPLPVSLIDDARIVEWRTHCTSNSYTCDYIADDVRIDDILSIIASCGYARPYQSDLWGVIIDYDRSTESPVQVFTGHNARGFKFRKALTRLPDGLRISYRSDVDDYTTQQVNVYRDDIQQYDQSRIEQVTYEGLIDTTKIEARGRYDMRQGQYRSTFYVLEAPFEWVVCRRGSMVAVQNDILTHHSASARIKTVTTSAGNVVSIVLNTEVDVYNTADMTSVTDVLAVTDMLALMKMGVSIRRTDGTISTHALSNVDGTTATLTFATPFADDTWTSGSPYDSGAVHDVEPGCIVAVGPLDQEYIRLIVTEISPGPELTARLTMVDEAPELWAA